MLWLLSCLRTVCCYYSFASFCSSFYPTLGETKGVNFCNSTVFIWPSHMESRTEFSQDPFLHWNSPKALQKINKVLIGSKKPSYTSFFHFRENYFFWRQPHFFLSLEVHPECAWSLIRPWWFSLKRIRTLTNIFLKNFFFWWSPHFSNLKNNQFPKKVYAISIGPEKPSCTFFSIS